jgi:hypothetical protein
MATSTTQKNEADTKPSTTATSPAAAAPPTVDEIWTQMQTSFTITKVEDEIILVKLLRELSNLVKPSLPQILRPGIVKDTCSFLVAPTEKVGKTLKEYPATHIRN